MRQRASMPREPLTVPGEREPPLHFAGRFDELAALESKLTRLCDTGDPSGGLQLTVGVPGVGKTQLAVEFGKRVAGMRLRGREVAAADVSADELDSPVDLFKTMGCALDEDARSSQVAQHEDRLSGATLGALGVRGAVAMDIARHTPDFPGLLRESMRAGMWNNKALVLMVDEVQGTGQAGMHALRVLHAGKHGCPILLLGFGLQHTERRLANPPGGRGISRIATPSRLTALDADATLDAFDGNLRALGHHDVPAESLHALAEASLGFPQHVNGYLEGAHEALLRHGNLTGDALTQALRHGHGRRAAYYNARLTKAGGRKPMVALSAMLESAGVADLDYDDALVALEAAGFDAEQLEAAIEHGALVHDDDDKVSFGIPSFHQHMADLRIGSRAPPGQTR